jgi:hypothetical protein
MKMLSAEPLEPPTEYPETIPIEPEPPTIILSPARRRLDTRLAIHGAVQAIRLALQHNARASVGLNRAPATFISGELRLGAVAAKAAQKKLRKAPDLLREPNIPHPGITPGCRELPRYPKPRNQKEFNAWLPITYYRLFLSPILQDGRMLATIPERLVPLEAPVIKGLVIYAAELKGTGTRYFAAWTEWGGTFIGWMRTRPNLAGGEQNSVHAIGEVLGRSVFKTEDCSSSTVHDAMEFFQQALQQAANDLGAA